MIRLAFLSSLLLAGCAVLQPQELLTPEAVAQASAVNFDHRLGLATFDTQQVRKQTVRADGAAIYADPYISCIIDLPRRTPRCALAMGVQYTAFDWVTVQGVKVDTGEGLQFHARKSDRQWVNHCSHHGRCDFETVLMEYLDIDKIRCVDEQCPAVLVVADREVPVTLARAEIDGALMRVRQVLASQQ